MARKSNSIIQKFIPSTIFGRMFWGIFLVTIVSLALVWSWFYTRVYASLNTDAETRLKMMAETIAFEIKKENNSNLDAKSRGKEILNSLWLYEKSGSWVQNIYWLNVSGPNPSFIASFSARNMTKKSMQGPSPEEAEDMVFAFINELEKGSAVMPDPFLLGASRRFKIVLFPILDSYQMLESVIGIEADMEYLKLAMQLKKFFVEILLASLLLSLFTALVLAQNLSEKILLVLNNLKEIKKGRIPEDHQLNVRELDQLHDGLVSLAQEIKDKDERLQELFARKLEELSFIGGAIAHEVRNPLSAIEMHFGLLKRQLNNEDSGEIAAMSEIAEQLLHLRSLIDNFLSYSRRVKPQKECFLVGAFISSLVESCKMVSGDFSCEIDIPTEMEIDFDRTMLQQICENIINNAVEACPEGELQMKIFAGFENRNWVLKFENNGPPISDEVLERLFTPFVTSKLDGHGIGLALVRKLLEAHDGEINCISSGAGVTFVIEVPR